MITAARRITGWPEVIPRARAGRSIRGDGLRYERALGAALEAPAEHGVWFEYASTEKGERSLCQVDWLLNWLPSAVFVLECKLSYTPEAEEKLRALYVPVVSRALGTRRVFGVVVCKRLLPGAANVVSSLEEAVRVADRCVPVWHWQPRGRWLRRAA